jgi:hypothetical protein
LLPWGLVCDCDCGGDLEQRITFYYHHDDGHDDDVLCPNIHMLQKSEAKGTPIVFCVLLLSVFELDNIISRGVYYQSHGELMHAMLQLLSTC